MIKTLAIGVVSSFLMISAAYAAGGHHHDGFSWSKYNVSEENGVTMSMEIIHHNAENIIYNCKKNNSNHKACADAKKIMDIGSNYVD